MKARKHWAHGPKTALICPPTAQLGLARLAARAAATLAFASPVKLFWTLGGSLLLDTVGGAPEDLARQGTLGSFAFGAAVVLVKVTAGLLALALLGQRDGWLRPTHEGRGRGRVPAARA